MDIVHPRVAGIDVHKKVVWVAVRLPGERPGERSVTVRQFATFWRSLQQLAAWLAEMGISTAAMESTACTGGLSITLLGLFALIRPGHTGKMIGDSLSGIFVALMLAALAQVPVQRYSSFATMRGVYRMLGHATTRPLPSGSRGLPKRRDFWLGALQIPERSVTDNVSTFSRG